MARLHVLSVVGTRPNFMKVAPVAAALARRPETFSHTLVHTGQHYDPAMSGVFFEELGLEEPQADLRVGPGSHGQQTARVMERLEPLLVDTRPDLLLVPGDVNSTLAAALAAVKLGIPVAHVEAGLRSFDRTMPEEINRLLTDTISEVLFIHSPEARTNLEREGRPAAAIHDVGNTMIDTLVAMRSRIEAAAPPRAQGSSDGYIVVTLHRPALTDGERLRETFVELARLSRTLPVIFPMHPRTRSRLEDAGLPLTDAPGLQVLDPLGYIEFLGLVAGATAVVTDSGGIQEETTFLGIPCFTLRDNTERPVTVTMGTNTLLGLDPGRIGDVLTLVPETRARPHRIPPGWDGLAGERIADVLSGTEARQRSGSSRR